MRLAHVVIERCNLANVRAPRAAMRRTLISGSRLTGVDFAHASLTDVTIRGCRMDLASLRSCTLERVSFEDCLLAQTDLLDASLKHVSLVDCDMSRADLRGARLERCDMRRANLTELEGVTALKGVSMPWPDIVEMAGVWASALGIRVLED